MKTEEKEAKLAAEAKRIAALEREATNAQRLEARVVWLESSQVELAVVKAALAELLRERATVTRTRWEVPGSTK